VYWRWLCRLTTPILFFYVTGARSAVAQRLIPTDSAAYYVGKKVTVCATVAGTFLSQKKQYIAYLNLEKPYPERPSTVVIFESGLERFDYDPVEVLKGKAICVTGRIEVYKEKPQIIVNYPGQIEIQAWKSVHGD